MRWNRKHKEYYESKGYAFTKVYDEFEVEVKDLKPKSKALVEVMCDYCSEKGIETIITEYYRDYVIGRKRIEKDACNNCRMIKHKDVIRLLYNIDNIMELESAKEKISLKESGRNNYNWKGGERNLSKAVRQWISEWKLKSLKSNGYKCVITGMKSHEMEIHHVEALNQIINNILFDLDIPVKEDYGDYTHNEMMRIKQSITEYHKHNLGVPLLPEVHKLYHHLFGYEDNNVEQFNLFIKNFDNHIYDGLLNIRRII
jgi:hypothetical protein